MYIIQKTITKSSDNSSYNTADVIFEDDNGFAWICECGRWDSESAQEKAKLICDLLNSTLEK